ncbi:MAG: glycosyltransferase family 2 protein [Cyclobacteriaceae bacterium]
MKVSVIIPSYNSYAFIPQTLESVFNQSYQKLEVIVVDDGSIDKTLKIIQRYQDRIQIIQQENMGACAARNKGFEHATGQFIQFLDADDLLSTNKIESQIKVLMENPDNITNGRWGRFYSNDPYNEKIQWGPDASLQKDMDPVSWLCQNHMSQTACWLTPRDLIEKAGVWDESLTQNQDGEFFSRVVSKSKKVIYTPEAKVYYRSNLPNSITRNTKNKVKIASRFKFCQSFEKSLLGLEDSLRTRLAIANKYQHFVYSAFPYRMDLIREAEKKIFYFGGSSMKPYTGGNLDNLISSIFGWKFSAHLRYMKETIINKH